MPKETTHKRYFNMGEVSEAFYHSTREDAYQKGAAELSNMIPRRVGGTSSRPGTYLKSVFKRPHRVEVFNYAGVQYFIVWDGSFLLVFDKELASPVYHTEWETNLDIQTVQNDNTLYLLTNNTQDPVFKLTLDTGEFRFNPLPVRELEEFLSDDHTPTFTSPEPPSDFPTIPDTPPPGSAFPTPPALPPLPPFPTNPWDEPGGFAPENFGQGLISLGQVDDVTFLCGGSGLIEVPVRLSTQPEFAVSVWIQVDGPGVTPQRLASFAPGETEKTVSFSFDETGTHTFNIGTVNTHNVFFEGESQAQPEFTVDSNNSSATVTATEQHINVAIGDTTAVFENGSGTLEFPVTMSHAAAIAANFTYTIADDSGTEVDSGTLSIPAGDTSASISYTADSEGTYTATLAFRTAFGANIDGCATITDSTAEGTAAEQVEAPAPTFREETFTSEFGGGTFTGGHVYIDNAPEGEMYMRVDTPGDLSGNYRVNYRAGDGFVMTYADGGGGDPLTAYLKFCPTDGTATASHTISISNVFAFTVNRTNVAEFPPGCDPTET